MVNKITADEVRRRLDAGEALAFVDAQAPGPGIRRTPSSPAPSVSRPLRRSSTSARSLATGRSLPTAADRTRPPVPVWHRRLPSTAGARPDR